MDGSGCGVISIVTVGVCSVCSVVYGALCLGLGLAFSLFLCTPFYLHY